MLKTKYKLAICTNSSRELFDIAIQKLPIKFDYEFISDEVKVNKPHRKIYEIAIQSLGFNIENILHVASSQMDVKGAKNAGLRVCWINRLKEKRASETPIPDFEIYKLDKIINIIGEKECYTISQSSFSQH